MTWKGHNMNQTELKKLKEETKKVLQQLYTIYDNKVNTHQLPISFRDNEHALGEISLFINSKENAQIAPIEFDLFHIGEFDNDTGKIISSTPVHIINLQQLKLPEKETVK